MFFQVSARSEVGQSIGQRLAKPDDRQARTASRPDRRSLHRRSTADQGLRPEVRNRPLDADPALVRAAA